jgi:hypothetical protein
MILYHYTTAEGLQGIITSKSVWASDYRFLSDTAEFNYGLSIFEKIFDRLAKELPSDVVEVIQGHIKNHFKGISDFPFNLLIASFCEDDDLLSQWRGYNGAIGYAIGFNGDWLQQNAEQQDFRLIPACYQPAEQEQTIVDRFTLLKRLLTEEAPQNPSWNTVKRWWPLMLVSMAALKNKHFKAEREWRLVKATTGWPAGISTRAGRSGLVPYLPVKLDAKIIQNARFHPRNVGIERIIVGPGLSDQQRTAVDALLASQHMRLEIGKSDIPYIPNK